VHLDYTHHNVRISLGSIPLRNMSDIFLPSFSKKSPSSIKINLGLSNTLYTSVWFDGYASVLQPLAPIQFLYYQI
jgi:hypothetical protein